mmetsp:Transcript_41566/g.69136  ORF Transcript_41566/g.69136 Transcript_41566/m.69136 type:complete len:283 (+) Transcript_41566:15-863(+)|eukprot:CAMPEP_0119304440 /NCGR_PEP_ID=MMETSP1333-20130426/5660_1 /TAXON_ID=418940 /ORGANISM="Scyphosphaera apsteinii, Strain RCC1455" /LENGTH=282 /DNA_ID=CAMNT_0007307331 /DNA_START=13 /DNA_END=861 /DNA_ORIENTATION=+
MWKDLIFLVVCSRAAGLVIDSIPRSMQLRRCAAPACSVAVFGASGGTGGEAAFQALGRGESVVAFVRDPAKLLVPVGSGGPSAGQPLTNEKLSVVQGDVTKRADVAKVFATGDVTGVVVALGGKTSDVGKTMLQDGTANIIAEMKASGVKRISVVTTVGAGDSMDEAPWAMKLLFATVMSSIIADKNKQEELFLSGPGAELEYCVVRPGGLKDDQPNGIVNVDKGEAGAIARGDVAAFCLDAVLEPDFKYLRQTPSICSDKGSGFDSVLADKTKSRMAVPKK